MHYNAHHSPSCHPNPRSSPPPATPVPETNAQLFKYVFVNLIPETILHTRTQDEEQVRDTYDRGNDFYSWFLGPRMIYTSGMIKDVHRQETLEELQDNKLTTVCEKLDLRKGDRMLDIGCGWGTLAAFAAKNYGADVTGGTFRIFSVCCPRREDEVGEIFGGSLGADYE